MRLDSQGWLCFIPSPSSSQTVPYPGPLSNTHHTIPKPHRRPTADSHQPDIPNTKRGTQKGSIPATPCSPSNSGTIDDTLFPPVQKPPPFHPTTLLLLRASSQPELQLGSSYLARPFKHTLSDQS